MSRLLRALPLTVALVGLTSLFATGCVVEERTVVADGQQSEVAPPAEQSEAPGPAPSARHFWVRGHWRWTGHEYVWVQGHWDTLRDGFEWVHGHWESRGRHWVWIEGHWVRR